MKLKQCYKHLIYALFDYYIFSISDSFHPFISSPATTKVWNLWFSTMVYNTWMVYNVIIFTMYSRICHLFILHHSRKSARGTFVVNILIIAHFYLFSVLLLFFSHFLLLIRIQMYIKFSSFNFSTFHSSQYSSPLTRTNLFCTSVDSNKTHTMSHLLLLTCSFYIPVAYWIRLFAKWTILILQMVEHFQANRISITFW